MAKIKTNEQAIRAMIKEMHTIEVAILAERILMMMDLTEQDMKDDPEAWAKGFVRPDVMQGVIDMVRKHLGPQTNS